MSGRDRDRENPNPYSRQIARDVDRGAEEIREQIAAHKKKLGLKSKGENVPVEKTINYEPKPDPPDYIKFKLKYIFARADKLNENDLEWAVKMEEAFNIAGTLSVRQCEVLHRIYVKAG